MVSERSSSWPEPSHDEDVFKALQFYYADWPYYDDSGRNRDMAAKVGSNVNIAILTSLAITYTVNALFFFSMFCIILQVHKCLKDKVQFHLMYLICQISYFDNFTAGNR